MKIRSQFLICLVVFSIMLAVIAATVTITQQQVAQLTAQEEIAGNIERGASSLNSVAIDYFLYQEDNLQLPRWDSQLSSLSNDLSSLELSSSHQQTLANVVAEDLQELNALFDEVVVYLQDASRNVSVRIDPAFQARWSTMAIRSIDLAAHASQLSQSIGDQAHQANNLSTALNVSLVAAFGAFLATIYVIVFRRTLKSVAKLQKGINTIGSGNLDYVIETKRDDEIAELSHSFNQMAANLKTVTACKADLENEVAGRKLAETGLRESEQRWSTTLSSIGDAVIATDLSGKVTFMNSVAEELTGWTLTEASNDPVKKVFSIINELTRKEVEDPVAKVLENGMIVGLANHTVLIRKDGTEIAIDDSGAPIKDKNGNTTGVVLIFRDITERKKNEEKISQQALMISNANDAIIGYDLNYRVTFWNKAAEHMYGYTPEEAMGKVSVDLLKPSYVNVTREELIAKIANEGHAESESVRSAKDGRSLNVEAHIILLRDERGKPIGYVSVDRDITKRKKNEATIRESEQRFRSTLENMLEGCQIIGRDWRYIYINDAAERHNRRPREELLGNRYMDVWPGIESTKVFAVIKKCLEKRVSQSMENQFTFPDGATGWFDLRIEAVPEGVFILSMDITERKQMEDKIEEYTRNLENLVEDRTKKLELSSMYARNLIEASLDPLVTISKEGKITDVNEATEEATGCPREQLIGSDFSDYFTEPEQARAGYQKVFTEGYVKDYPLAIRHKTGQITDVLYNASIYRNSEGEIEGVFAAARDITELKKAEQQEQATAKKLKDTERLAAIGATAGMVGHDIRNPLQAIIGDVFLAKGDVDSLKKSEEKESLIESLAAIEKNTEYINKIVADLQDFARPLNPHTEETDLNQIVKELLSKNGLPDNIKQKVKITKDTQTLTTDQAYIKRILGNLINNAVQAMPNGGILTINANTKNNKITITIRDTGIGIPDDVKPKLFTPLFTTKSKGQGFGLAVVKRMTEALNGTVTLESQLGKGTTFTITLPQKP